MSIANKLIKFLFALIACFSLIACNQNISEVKNITSQNVNSYENVESIYEIYVPICDANEVLKIEEVMLPEKLNGMNMSCSKIYNESNVIVVLYTESPNIVIHEIGMYNFETDRYKKLINIDKNMDFEICTSNDNYMIVKLSEDDWRTCQLYYYNFTKMDLVKFFSYTVDTNTNALYFQSENNILLIDDKVYFDDFYMDTNGKIRVNLYEYTIEEQKLITLFEDAQNPMLYNGNVASFRKNSEGKFKDIVSNDNIVLINTRDLKDIVANENGFYCIENKETNHTTKTTLFQITDMIKNKPVLSTYSSIANLRSNNRFVAWVNYYDEKPYIYDTEKEQLVLFSDVSSGINNFCFSDDLGVLINTKDSKNRFYLFKSR
ncbi:hypothetical protein DW1_2305 [Proteiniborus sp. DW1]|uniref:hypothetical protein n=1 Tax=Proteiniborus sp. DW1 TaxID=1889883 RepID=UPI00092E0CA0|nr:hypothetical protein [Proteiniborus sp. DW1]SCG83869.1 hypothetical protein DW1_2305 [Proteiniborus sp. DW1]